jgi:DNA-binding response OmpR family regulator
MGNKDTRILYLEDEPDVSRMVSRVLGIEGYTIIEASRGTKGLDFIYESFPHLIMLDLRMAVMSGYEFLKTVKAQSGLCEIPIICVTGLTRIQSIYDAFSQGADGYVFKPVDFEFLLFLIRFFLEKGPLEERYSRLLSHPAFEEAAMLSGKEVDSLEKLDLLMAIESLGGSAAGREELDAVFQLKHKALENEIRELEIAGFIHEDQRTGRITARREEGWPRRFENLRRLTSRPETLQAFSNGIYTGALAYGFETGILG